MKRLTLFMALAMSVCAMSANAAFVDYTDRADYLNQVAAESMSLTMIDFTGLAAGTTLTNQYAGLDVMFDGSDTIVNNTAFVEDGWGVYDIGTIELMFIAPMTHVGADFPGTLAIDLYQGTTLVASSADFGSTGTGFFGGRLTDDSFFDRVILSDWNGPVASIDTLYFGGVVGSVVPEPASLSLLGIGLAGMAIRRIRRKHV
jgi:hypothetical protein